MYSINQHNWLWQSGKRETAIARFEFQSARINPRRVKRSKSITTALLASVMLSSLAIPSAQAAGSRPLFQAPFQCSQIWEASTYDKHWPDQDSIDLAERDENNKVISKGQPVLASAAGTVLKSFTTSGGEYRVYIDHGAGWVTHNIHMEPDDASPMKVGRRVAQGEQIGRTGNSGAKAVHQHYTQLRDGKAVRIKFNGISINTHAGNKDSYGTWGKDDAERIISLNCPGNSFMGWYQNGDRYHQIYKPGTGKTKILRMDANSAAAESTWVGNWSRGWTHFIPFYLKTGGHPHAIVYKSSTGKVNFNRLKLNGAGVTNLMNGTWWKGWTHFTPFTLNGVPYFLAYDSVHGYANIDRIHPTGDGTKSVYKKTWIKGRTQIVPFKLGPAQYLLLYKGGDGSVKITKITGSGDNVATNGVWSGNWSTGYANIVPVAHEGAMYLLAYKTATGKAKVLKLKAGGQGVSTVSNMNWTKSWTAFSPFGKNGKGHILIYKAGTGQVKTLRLNPGGNGVETIWTKSWTTGWK